MLWTLTLSSNVIRCAISIGIPTSFTFLKASPVMTLREEKPEPFRMKSVLIFSVQAFEEELSEILDTPNLMSMFLVGFAVPLT